MGPSLIHILDVGKLKCNLKELIFYSAFEGTRNQLSSFISNELEFWLYFYAASFEFVINVINFRHLNREP